MFDHLHLQVMKTPLNSDSVTNLETLVAPAVRKAEVNENGQSPTLNLGYWNVSFRMAYATFYPGCGGRADLAALVAGWRANSHL